MSSNALLAVARAAGLLRKAPVAAVHTFVVQAPDGSSRTFRYAYYTFPHCLTIFIERIARHVVLLHACTAICRLHRVHLLLA